MSVLLAPNTPGLEEASARLAELERADTAEATAPVQQEQREPAADAGGSGPAAAGATQDNQDPNAQKTDTPADADTAAGKKPEADKAAEDKDNNLEAGKGGDKKPADQTDKGKSAYAKSQERLEKTWDNVNKRKTELDTREQQVAEKQRQLEQREEQFRRQTEESQTQYKPEDVEKAAGQKLERAKALNERADGLEAKAKKLDDDGKYQDAARLNDEAKKLRKQANKEEGNAEDLKAHAEDLRKNPPASFAEREKKTEVQRKEWTLKAAQDFPELGKQGSELQKAVGAALNQLWQTDRVLASHPQIIYHVTRLTAAETAAARVPALEKQLGELTAKVQDYEKLTSPGGPGAAQRVDTSAQPKTDADERAELGDMAASMGAFR
jgi:chromosome segregation ATPase